MTYKQWVKKHGHLDKIVAGLLPTAANLDKMTMKAIKERFADKIIQAARGLGIELNDKDLDKILHRVAGVPDWPDFQQSHYDLHS